jgi:molybdopterin molybdotransferase
MERLLAIRDDIVRAISPVPSEEVALDRALGRFLAEPARARVDAPPHTCSAMDGYAVRAKDVTGPCELEVVATVYAGDAPAPLPPGRAARIFTGATVPDGADAVVRQEATRADGDRVRFSGPARPGENVRLAGEDVARGGVALEAGARIGARQAALLAAVGVERLVVRRVARVAILSTGDEIVSGRTPNTNGVALAGLVAAAGATPVDPLAAADRLESVESVLELALAGADAVITIGGVSVGERDLVPAALARRGADVRVHGVPMKPGKPFLFALAGGKPVLGMPGSPSACLAAFEVFARPALRALAGATRRERPAVRLPLAEAVDGRTGRARLLWARLDGRSVRPIGRDAAQVRGPALADALIVLPADAGALPAGAEVFTWLLDEDAPSAGAGG